MIGRGIKLRKQVRGIVKKKRKEIWDGVVPRANNDLEGETKKLWRGINGMAKIVGRGGVHGRLVNSGNDKRKITAGCYL